MNKKNAIGYTEIVFFVIVIFIAVLISIPKFSKPSTYKEQNRKTNVETKVVKETNNSNTNSNYNNNNTNNNYGNTNSNYNNNNSNYNNSNYNNTNSNYGNTNSNYNNNNSNYNNTNSNYNNYNNSNYNRPAQQVANTSRYDNFSTKKDVRSSSSTKLKRTSGGGFMPPDP